MENFKLTVFQNLVKVLSMQNYRKQAYTKAAYVSNNKPLRAYFNELIAESDYFAEELQHCINEIEVELKMDKPRSHPENIEKSQFYYAIAKTNSNLRTVCLSCKLGDVSCMKIYEDILGFGNIYQFPTIKMMIQKQKARLESHVNSTYELTFE